MVASGPAARGRGYGRTALIGSPLALEAAARMGTRRGALFVDDGVPTPNPFPAEHVPALAAAWRTGYLAVVGPALAAVQQRHPRHGT